MTTDFLKACIGDSPSVIFSNTDGTERKIKELQITVMSNGYWKDDGDGQSYSLWSSKEAYENDRAELIGQVDFMEYPKAFKKLWKAIAFKGNQVIESWLNDRDKAMLFVCEALAQN